ncbi:10719_t:CDS:1, partial [Acaulospora colombiana]
MRYRKNFMRKNENEPRSPDQSDLEAISSIASTEVPVARTKNTNTLIRLNIDEAISLHNDNRYKEAFPHFLRLANRGDFKAAYYAGLYFYVGYGIDKDEIKALLYLEKSAQCDYARGQYLYAHACLKGTYYSKDEGIKYLKKAALENDPDALYMFSQLYLLGEHGYPENNEKYNYYLKMAAENGSKEAQQEL